MDDIIARRKLRATSGKRKRPLEDEGDQEEDDAEEDEEDSGSSVDEEDEDGSEGSEDGFEGVSEEEDEEDPLVTSEEEGIEVEENEDMSDDVGDDAEDAASSSDDDSEEETQAEKERKAAFFDSESGPSDAHTSFLSMNLSRPIIKSLTSLGFTTPTPIQAATIPVALLGKDVVGNAVTGSGKTAAFIIPMLERLMYRDRGKKAAATRCLVLVPTRELGVQCYEVGTKLAAHTDVRFALVVGSGVRYSLREEWVVDQARPFPSRWSLCEGTRSQPTHAPGCRHCYPRTTHRPHSQLSHLHPRCSRHPCAGRS